MALDSSTPLVPDSRLKAIIRGYVAEHSAKDSRPDMSSEWHLLKLARLISDEAKARIPLWRLEAWGARGPSAIDILKEASVCSVAVENGELVFTEGCEAYFSTSLTRQQVLDLAQELVELADALKK